MTIHDINETRETSIEGMLNKLVLRLLVTKEQKAREVSRHANNR